MKKENESLSEKREQKYSTHVGKGIGYYPEKDVKEFIKKLKEEMDIEFEKETKFFTEEAEFIGQRVKRKEIFDLIDKLAGEKLI